MNRLVRDESGFTLIELVVVTFVTVLLMAGLSNLFVSGLRTSKTTNDILSSQTQIHDALGRLEYEARCSSQAALVSSGAGVTLTLPSECTHATGTVTWCVTSGSLIRYAAASCTGTGTTLATNITSATPFSCVSTVGDYPELQVALAVETQTAADQATATDEIAMRNAALTTSTTSSCA
ncbi:MAG: prepilin-type N-terminal cleavage/methylation domain-containing protein [Gaiellaceae bacterium]